MTGAISTLAKTLFFYLCGVVWTTLWAYGLVVPVAIVERLCGLENTQWAQTLLHWGVVKCSLPWRQVAKVHIDGRQRAQEGQVVVICNHHSYLDIFLLFHLFVRIHMTTRRSLFRIPVLGWAMSLLQHLPHHADRPQEALDRAAEWLGRGRYVGVFPEGTRSPSAVIGRFNAGAFRLARQSTQLIQPVVVVGTGRVWGKGQFWIRTLGPVAIKVLQPIPVPADLGHRDLRALIAKTREKMIAEHQALAGELLAVSG